jgi:XTP/dITP diphosphohydrolase
VLELLFGTTNPGKLRELRRLVSGLDVRVVSPEDLGRPLPEVVEDGRTFHENAAKKASAYARFSGLHALADDSGLCVDALGGVPGIHSARWSEPDGLASPACAVPQVAARELGPELSRLARDEANNDKLLAALASVPEAQRGARYVAALVLARPDGTIAAQVEGICAGRIGRVRRGARGFGYDPLFVPDEGAAGLAGPGDRSAAAPVALRTMAELESSEKDAISHRGAAFRALRPVLEQLAFDKTGR